MKKKRRTMYRLLVTFTMLISIGPLNAQTIDSNHIDGLVYVRVFDSSSIDLNPYTFADPALNVLYGIFGIDTITRPFGGLTNELDRTHRITFQQFGLIDSFITALSLLPYIEYAEKAPLYRTSLSPNDIHPEQYAIDIIEAAAAWDITTGSGNVTIAIVDNAVSTTHEDLADNIWVNPNEIPGNGFDDDLNGYVDDVNGWDAADGDNNPNPPASAGTSSPFVHGTHCAGIASATTDNDKGMAGVGYNTKIIAVKCSRNGASDQGASLPSAYDGVVYATFAGADIISMSWGGSSGIFVTGESIMSAASSQGIVLVAAAGNSNTSEPFYPASYSNVISVGSTNSSDVRSGFSNYGATVDVMAPGSLIYSTLSGTDTSYGKLSGTSMACPLVAGICGLIISQDPTISASQVQQQLKSGCENIDSLNQGFIGQIGSGRVNAFRSMQGVTGIESEAYVVEIKVYPNPTHGRVYIENNAALYLDLQLFSITGNLVKSRKTNESSIVLDLKVPSGIYLLQLTSPESHVVKEMVIY